MDLGYREFDPYNQRPEPKSEGSSALITSQRLTSGSHLLVFKVWDTAGDVFDASQTTTVN